MEMLFVALGGAVIGAALRYLLPSRDTYGALFLPGVGVVVASVVWAGLTWLGWKFDGGWIWVVSLVVSGLVCLALALLLPRRRRVSDEAMLARLSRA